jgi:hypothetical protein
MYKTLSFFKYNPRLSVEECERHYRTVHTPLIVEMFRDVPGFRAYQQGRVTSARAYAHNSLPPFAIEPEFHRVVELHWDAIPDLSSLGDAGARAFADHPNFMDVDSPISMTTYEVEHVTAYETGTSTP